MKYEMNVEEAKKQLQKWGIPQKEIESRSSDKEKFEEFYFDINHKNSLTIGYTCDEGIIRELDDELKESAKGFGLVWEHAGTWLGGANGNEKPVRDLEFVSYDKPLTLIKEDQIKKHFKKIINRFDVEAMQLV